MVRRVQASAAMRASFAFLAFVLACSTGCSSSTNSGPAPAALASVNGAANTATSPTAQSGSRLRAKYVGSGDSRQLVGFFDNQRQEDCAFQPAEGGRIRCLPTNMTVATGGAGGFSDASCTISTAPAPTTGCAAPAYAMVEQYDESTCGIAPYQIHKVLPASAPLYLQTASSCALAPAGTPFAPNVLRLGESISWAEFAEGTVANIAGALTERRLSTTDGASATYGYHLDDLEADCRFRVMSDGNARCVPEALTGPVLYADGNCSEPSAITYYGNSPTPIGAGCAAPSGPLLYVADGSKGGDTYTSKISCSGINAVYKVLDTGTSDTLYEALTPTETNHATCSSSSNYYQSSYTRKLGDNITAALPAAARNGSGSGRIVSALVESTGADRVSVLVPGFHDTQLDIDCTFETATDGKLRCLPTAPAAQLFFADLSCMSSSSIAVLGPDCTTSGDKRYGRTTSTSCPATTTVYALSDTSKDYTQGSALTGPSRCAQVSGINSGFDATIADPAQFAEGVFTTE